MGIWDAIVDSWHEASAKVDAEIHEKHKLKRGSVIRDDRDFYDHYGIYAGNKEVIHFTEGVVRLTSLQKMKGRSWGYIDVMCFDEKYTKSISLEQSLSRAKSCLGMTGYDLIENNCEHFALWCRTGNAFSTQAFGSNSSAYDVKSMAATGFLSFINIPRLISSIYSEEVGMDVSRTLDIELVNTDNA